jgi:hypothetical protein
MIAAFPKLNFFMSSWGMESYRRRGRNFMPELLESPSPPPMLLVNHGVLTPGSLLYRQISDVDRRLLESTYVDYWGPIKVAGAEFTIPARGSTAVSVPFPGRYRLESATPVQLDGNLIEPGETIEIARTAAGLAVTADSGGASLTARLVWAEARKAPDGPPPKTPLYSGL